MLGCSLTYCDADHGLAGYHWLARAAIGSRSVRDAASECNLAINTAMRALREMVDLGFIEETRHGGLSKKTRIASEWRLTVFKCDLTG